MSQGRNIYPSAAMAPRNQDTNGAATTTTAAIPSPAPLAVVPRLHSIATKAIVHRLSRIFGNDVQNPQAQRILATIPPCIAEDLFKSTLEDRKLCLPLLSYVLKTRGHSFKSLDVRDVRTGRFDGAAAQVLVSSGQQLTSLFLYEALVSTSSFLAMFPTLKNLTTLEVTMTPAFNDDVLTSVASNCPALQVLNIRWTGVGDKGVEALIKNNLALKTLDVVQTKVSMSGILMLHSSVMKESLTKLGCGDWGRSLRTDIWSCETVLFGFKNINELAYDFCLEWWSERITLYTQELERRGVTLKNIFL